MYYITLTIPVRHLRNKQEAEEVAEPILEHLSETFNDDGSLLTDAALLTDGAFYTATKQPPRITK